MSTLVLLIVPMVVFPEQFGTQLAKASLITAFYELVYYGVVVFLFNRRVTLLRLVEASGACLVYRFGVGAVFGGLIFGAYSLHLQVAVTMGMSGYLPAVVLHVLATPLVLKPVLAQFYQARPAPRGPVRPSPATDPGQRRRTSFAGSREKSFGPAVSRTAAPAAKRPGVADAGATEAGPVLAHSETNGFERAVRYIGEHAAVDLACVVDHEGLLLANFKRGDVDPEEWAPLSLLLFDGNGAVLGRGGLEVPEKIDLTLSRKRIVVACEQSFRLMVISDRQSDDFLNIRINQAMDMIDKYAAERYTQNAVDKLESTHVSST